MLVILLLPLSAKLMRWSSGGYPLGHDQLNMNHYYWSYPTAAEYPFKSDFLVLNGFPRGAGMTLLNRMNQTKMLMTLGDGLMMLFTSIKKQLSWFCNNSLLLRPAQIMDF